LHQAALQADADALLELIEPIRADHPILAVALTQLINDFRFDTLAALTSAPHPTREGRSSYD
jgi:hypothetical protein